MRLFVRTMEKSEEFGKKQNRLPRKKLRQPVEACEVRDVGAGN